VELIDQRDDYASSVVLGSAGAAEGKLSFIYWSGGADPNLTSAEKNSQPWISPEGKAENAVVGRNFGRHIASSRSFLTGLYGGNQHSKTEEPEMMRVLVANRGGDCRPFDSWIA